jgi:hypothetical protein
VSHRARIVARPQLPETPLRADSLENTSDHSIAASSQEGIGAPLGGLFSHQKGGFYHDGRFATVSDVVNHYDTCKNLQLSVSEKADLVQYLLTL